MYHHPRFINWLASTLLLQPFATFIAFNGKSRRQTPFEDFFPKPSSRVLPNPPRQADPKTSKSPTALHARPVQQERVREREKESKVDTKYHFKNTIEREWNTLLSRMNKETEQLNI
jgi:hypothetical protein